MTLHLPLSNQILDETTLRWVRGKLVGTTRLSCGVFAEFRRLFGIPIGIDRCALGVAFKVWPGDVPAFQFANPMPATYDHPALDPHTLCEIMRTTDAYTPDLTHEARAEAIKDWLDRAIRLATNAREQEEDRAECAAYGAPMPCANPEHVTAFGTSDREKVVA